MTAKLHKNSSWKHPIVVRIKKTSNCILIIFEIIVIILQNVTSLEILLSLSQGCFRLCGWPKPNWSPVCRLSSSHCQRILPIRSQIRMNVCRMPSNTPASGTPQKSGPAKRDTGSVSGQRQTFSDFMSGQVVHQQLLSTCLMYWQGIQLFFYNNKVFQNNYIVFLIGNLQQMIFLLEAATLAKLIPNKTTTNIFD